MTDPLSKTERPSRPRTAIGTALQVHGDAVDHCEALYRQHAGEVTDETEQAEAAVEATGMEALDHLARYLRWCDDQDEAIDRERERLETLEWRVKKRRTWASERVAALAEALRPGRARIQVGTATLKIQRTVAVEAALSLDPATLPASWIRWTEPKAPEPALDKKAAKADLLLGYREGVPPGSGLYDVEGLGPVQLVVDGLGRWWRDDGPNPGQGLDTLGFSIEPEPGLDVLRWRPHHPNVALVHRVHVKSV